MATCGKMWRSRRSIWALFLVVFLQLFDSSCLAASLSDTTQDKVQQADTLHVASLTTSVNKDTDSRGLTPPEQSPALPDIKNSVKAAGSIANTQPKTFTEDKDTHPDNIINADMKQEPVGNRDTVPGVGANEAGVNLTSTAVASTPPAPTASVKTTETIKVVTVAGQMLNTDSKVSITLDMSTVQYTYSDVLRTDNKDPAPRIDLDNYAEEEDDDGEEGDYGDGNDFVETRYENTVNGKDQSGKTLGQPDEAAKSRGKEVNVYDPDDEDSHFFFHLVVVAFLVAIIYITYHNKRRILLMAHSRRWKDALCSRNTVEYRRLDQNIDEAMPSLKMTKEYIF